MRAHSIVIAGVCAALLGGCGPVDQDDLDYNDADQIEAEVEEGKADSLSSTSTFYTVRRDFRRCISPVCGGYFLKRLNRVSTRCADGSYQDECYVAEADWTATNGTPENFDRTIVRGKIKAKNFPGFGNKGKAVITEAWVALNDHAPATKFYRMTDRGLRCFTAPCPSIHQAKLNSTVSANLNGIDLTSAGDNDNEIERGMNEFYSTGILASGKNTGGVFYASTFYLRYTGEPPAKVCKKTGCSGQICADGDRFSTCEWRPEYACYQTATCEVQADGECGWTMTSELQQCLTPTSTP